MEETEDMVNETQNNLFNFDNKSIDSTEWTTIQNPTEVPLEFPKEISSKEKCTILKQINYRRNGIFMEERKQLVKLLTDYMSIHNMMSNMCYID